MSYMFSPDLWANKLSAWLHQEALPFWCEVGIDRFRNIAWESVSPDGKPCEKANRRLRVQARQAFVFAQSPDTKYQRLGASLFRQIMDNGFAPGSGHLVQLYSPNNEILSAPHDLYDLSFVLLAASALIKAGYDLTSELARLDCALEKLKAPKGWYENAKMQTPRRQNPHMHLFEATTALYRVTGDLRYLYIAQECLELFLDVFLQNDHVLFEYFSHKLSPLCFPQQAVEPGHMAEWIYLIDQFERATGHKTDAPMKRIFKTVLSCRDPDGLLPDRSDCQSPQCRIWPQTEMLKAAIVMNQRGFHLDRLTRPESILENMWAVYFENSIQGGWVDTVGKNRMPVSKNIEASCFYHVYVAFSFYCAEAEKRPRWGNNISKTPDEYEFSVSGFCE